MTTFSPSDERFMQRALALARAGEGFVEPNPMVGCVLVRSGRIVGEGAHRIFGGPHAEREALAAAAGKARGATAYVTLEPCCHFGKTPPCTDALIEARVSRVVAAVRDPNPLVAGKGFRRLRAAGIRVETGLLNAQGMSLIAPFITYQTLGRPHVILKWAQSIDGKIATRSGDSKWITSIQSRRAAHAFRARVDAVLVGVDTVLADDPELTARLVKPRRIATRVVLDSKLKTPASSTLVRTAGQIPTLIVTTAAASGAGVSARAARLANAGCELLFIRSGRSGLHLEKLLRELHARRVTNLLVEGGGRVIGSFLDQGLADEAVIYVAPRLIGGETAPGALRGTGPRTMADLPPLDSVKARRCGPDLCYNVVFGRPDRRAGRKSGK